METTTSSSAAHTDTFCTDAQLYERRERVFLILAGVFLSSMTLLNVIGITRFVQLGPMSLAIGVLPYPITFLCTDLVCELYGKRRANFLVTVGLGLNIFILACLYLAQAVPPVSPDAMPPWQVLNLAEPVSMPNGDTVSGSVELFDFIYSLTSGAMFASMMAYIAAQYCDVQLFHFWKRLTNGKHLWLRNNFSTLISQGVDSFMVISVTFGAVWLAGGISTQQMLVLMGSNYLFKMCCALADTGPFYYLTFKLKRYLQL
ncbi:queuosine precursor transporter [Aestuariicella sp. G3-2]|uniref:queuosine precursor transporter n=1 Tax=Pseudomaricurvus albidus TaxID=2842452 RepID=UPI001C0ABDE3|nr:queuosine precursor transporter [Aestuariicella albida]MBU3071343.1 queuosine precursor transporter [Aestuariicella albida]